MIQQNVKKIIDQIAEATIKRGKGANVRLVAVSKTKSV
jgi:uncharacterized pyridoxal phosphate-containing UPF0001 family protein